MIQELVNNDTTFVCLLSMMVHYIWGSTQESLIIQVLGFNG